MRTFFKQFWAALWWLVRRPKVTIPPGEMCHECKVKPATEVIGRDTMVCSDCSVIERNW